MTLISFFVTASRVNCPMPRQLNTISSMAEPAISATLSEILYAALDPRVRS
jgi:ABC-type dipeptide/oligopeptide/nickel transport system permease component